MNDEQRTERIRLTFKRRIRNVIEQRGMRGLSNRDMFALSTRLTHVVGEYVSDGDLWTLIRLTQRGLFK